MLAENLLKALDVVEKCLNYDETAILCNATLDEPGQTNIPLTWRPVIESPDLVLHMFRLLTTDIRNSASTAIKIKCVQALRHVAYVRHAIFSSSESR